MDFQGGKEHIIYERGVQCHKDSFNASKGEEAKDTFRAGIYCGRTQIYTTKRRCSISTCDFVARLGRCCCAAC